MLVNDLNISLEDDSSVLFLAGGPVSTIVCFPFIESSVLGGLGGNVNGSCNKSSQSNKCQSLVHNRVGYYIIKQ